MILSTLSDAVSIYTWFQQHKLYLEDHMYTKAYHYIVTQIGGVNILLNIYSFTNVKTPYWKTPCYPQTKAPIKYQ